MILSIPTDKAYKWGYDRKSRKNSKKNLAFANLYGEMALLDDSLIDHKVNRIL